MPWYGWNIAHLALNSYHSLTVSHIIIQPDIFLLLLFVDQWRFDWGGQFPITDRTILYTTEMYYKEMWCKYHLSWPSNYCNIKIQLNLVVFDYKSVTNTYQGLRFEQTIEWNSKKGYGCKWKWETIQFYTWTQIKVKEQLLVRKDMDVNEHERLTNITLRYKIKVKEQLVVR